MIVLCVGIILGAAIFGALSKIKHQKVYEKLESQMLQTLYQLAQAHDNETGNHILRTQTYVKVLAKRLHQMGEHPELKPHLIQQIYDAAPLHDIGKIGIPLEILNKPSPLIPAEWEVMKNHPSIGESILSAFKNETPHLSGTLKVAIDITSAHHECWDGSGYPKGLKGNQIPLPARIMSLADTYDALVSRRIYKNSWPHEEALNYILANKNIRFDPLIVEAFVLDQEEFIRIARKFSDD